VGENSKIEWTDRTFNPWMGCTKVAAGCANCYAERDMDKHYHKVQWGPHGTRVKTSEANWRKPLKWNREAEAAGERKRVFCASLADVFEDWQGAIHTSGGQVVGHRFANEFVAAVNEFVPATMDDLRRDLFALIDATPWLDWLLLTKRPENIRRMIHANPAHRIWKMRPEDHGPRNPFYRGNVWLLTSVAEQCDADRNVPELLKCRDLVPVLGVSAEPLVGPINFETMTTDPPNSGFALTDGFGRFDGEPPSLIDWVIAGGESGPNARPMHPEWARSLRDQCQAAGVAFHYKQWGEWAPCEFGAGERHDPPPSELSHYLDSPPYKVWRFGKKAAGRLLDGREWNEYPVLQSTEH